MGKKNKWSQPAPAPKPDINRPFAPIHRQIPRSESIELSGAGSSTVASAVSVSLSCPLGQCPIQKPVRGRLCKHLQPFDHISYVRYMRQQERKPYIYKQLWRCPVCLMYAREDTLVHDLLLQDAIFSRNGAMQEKECRPATKKDRSDWSPTAEQFDCFSDSDVSDDEGVDTVYISPEYENGWRFKRDHVLTAKFKELSLEKKEKRRSAPVPTKNPTPLRSIPASSPIETDMNTRSPVRKRLRVEEQKVEKPKVLFPTQESTDSSTFGKSLATIAPVARKGPLHHSFYNTSRRNSVSSTSSKEMVTRSVVENRKPSLPFPRKQMPVVRPRSNSTISIESISSSGSSSGGKQLSRQPIPRKSPPVPKPKVTNPRNGTSRNHVYQVNKPKPVAHDGILTRSQARQQQAAGSRIVIDLDSD